MRGGVPWRGLALTLAGLGAAGWAAPPFAEGFWPEPLDRPTYADYVFGGLVPFDNVLAEQEWHPWPWKGLDCTFVVVSLPPNAPPLPPTRGRDAVGWRDTFGGEWQLTPVLDPGPREVGVRYITAVDLCAEGLGSTAGLLRDVASSPGSYFALGGYGSEMTLFLYSVPHRIAARIRYGD